MLTSSATNWVNHRYCTEKKTVGTKIHASSKITIVKADNNTQ